MEANLDWLLPLVGGLGIGAIFKSIVDYLLSKNATKKKAQYTEMREAYLGLLNALHKAAVEPSNQNSKEFALWQTKVQLFGSEAVAKSVQGIIDTNDGPRSKRDAFFNEMVAEMRKDLKSHSI